MILKLEDSQLISLLNAGMGGGLNIVRNKLGISGLVTS